VALRDKLDYLFVYVVDDYWHSCVADIRSGGLQLFASECLYCWSNPLVDRRSIIIFVLRYDVFDAEVGFCSP